MFLLAESGVNAVVETGPIFDVAKYEFWGVMLAVVVVMPVMSAFFGLIMGRSLSGTIKTISISINSLSDKIASVVAVTKEKLERIEDSIDDVSSDVKELKTGVNTLNQNVTDIDERVRDHETRLTCHDDAIQNIKTNKKSKRDKS